MENTWLDKYTDSGDRHFQPRPFAGILVGGFSIIVLACMVMGSMWVRMRDDVSANAAMEQLASAHSDAVAAAAVHSLPETLLAQAPEKENVNTGEEAFALQSVSDLSAQSDSNRSDPFAPIITGPNAGEDPTKPKDILDNVSFTGFIGDAKSKGKDKVAIIEIANPGGNPTALIKKVGESFDLQGEKVIVKDVKSNELFLSVGGARRTLDLAPYVDTASLSSSSGNSASGSSPNSTINNNPLPGGTAAAGSNNTSHEPATSGGSLHLAE